jgi:hypothetical protein
MLAAHGCAGGTLTYTHTDTYLFIAVAGPFSNIRVYSSTLLPIFFCLKTVPIVCTHVECTQGRRNISLIIG